jgi:dipeptide transport system ATP-binding protein
VQPELRPWLGGKVRCHYPLAAPNRDADIAAGAAERTLVS